MFNMEYDLYMNVLKLATEVSYLITCSLKMFCTILFHLTIPLLWCTKGNWKSSAPFSFINRSIYPLYDAEKANKCFAPFSLFSPTCDRLSNARFAWLCLVRVQQSMPFFNVWSCKHSLCWTSLVTSKLKIQHLNIP